VLTTAIFFFLPWLTSGFVNFEDVSMELHDDSEVVSFGDNWNHDSALKAPNTNAASRATLVTPHNSTSAGNMQVFPVSPSSPNPYHLRGNPISFSSDPVDPITDAHANGDREVGECVDGSGIVEIEETSMDEDNYPRQYFPDVLNVFDAGVDAVNGLYLRQNSCNSVLCYANTAGTGFQELIFVFPHVLAN
jgi:hypothetical protein